jgi:hypothetical protein
MSIDPKVTHRIIGTDAEIADETGLTIKPDAVYEDLSRFDLLYVSGGLGTVALMDNKRAIDYLKTWATNGRRPRSARVPCSWAAPATSRTSARPPITSPPTCSAPSAARW